MIDDRRARMALACVTEPGDPELQRQIQLYGPQEVWERLSGAEHGETNQAWARRARAVDLDAVQRIAETAGLQYLVPGDPHWPRHLSDLDHSEPVADMRGAPLGLWTRGDTSLLPRLRDRGVAIVGSRAATAYGDHMALEFAAEFTTQGWVVVSGGAYGIDAAAHRGVLATGGATVCVLACGVDSSYPRAHERLLADIATSGLLVGELPPGANPMRSRFLSRNRLIAALTAGTVVVEAAMRSGARNTASWAEALSRPIMAVPGPVTAANSWTPHQLIRSQGAELVTCAGEAIEYLAPLGQALLPIPAGGAERAFDRLPARAQQVFEHLPSTGWASAEQIAAGCGLPPATVWQELNGLLDRAMVRRTRTGWQAVPAAAR